MKMIIREFWEKVDTSHKVGGMFPVIKGEYVLKSSSTYPNAGGWKAEKDFADNAKHRNKYLGKDDGGYKFDLGTAYGINSYQIVSFEA